MDVLTRLAYLAAGLTECGLLDKIAVGPVLPSAPNPLANLAIRPMGGPAASPQQPMADMASQPVSGPPRGREGWLVTKKEIARAIAKGSGISQGQALEVVQRVFDGIVETLASGGRIELRNFGVFEVKRRKPRKARNPHTGARLVVPETLVVTFKPGRAMTERVRGLKNEAPEGDKDV